MQIIECTQEGEIASTFPVMQQLRPHLKDYEYISLIRGIEKNGGRLIAAFEESRCVGAALFRYQLRTSCGPMIYVDDLVTDHTKRSQGVGNILLQWIMDEAKKMKCTRIVLDSGVQRDQAHKFYFREGFIVTAFNFSRSI